jgi:hypothetical protein
MAAVLVTASGCGGTTAVAGASDGAVDGGAEAATETDARESEEAQSDATIDASIDASGPALCIALGAQCYFGAFTCDYSPSVPVDCGSNGICCLEHVTFPDGSGAPADECIEAGGQCKVGGFACAVQGPQSCGPQGPGGLRCCLSEPDAGAD